MDLSPSPTDGVVSSWNMEVTYSELATTSNFSFLRGASHPEELLARAAKLGHSSLGLADWNTCAGLVRAHEAAQEIGIRLCVGVRVLFRMQHASEEAPIFSFLAYPHNKTAYGLLTEILSLGKQRSGHWELCPDNPFSLGPSPETNNCLLYFEDLLPIFASDCSCIFLPPWLTTDAHQEPALLMFQHMLHACQQTSCAQHGFFSLGLARLYEHEEESLFQEARFLSKSLRIPLLALGDVSYHEPSRKPLADVLFCIREKHTLDSAGLRLRANAERVLRSPEEMHYLFRKIPEALLRGQEVVQHLSFSLSQLSYQYPEEICPEQQTPRSYLAECTWAGAKEKFPSGIPEKITLLLQQELSLIGELGYEKYFLTCADIVRYARSLGILCQGRGAAANSAVCFCLGITSVNPADIETLFARFISKERHEPPDIDIDFEHERREEVIQYIYEKYGRDRAALVCTVICFRARSALREVSKVFGLSPDIIDALAKSLHRWTGCELQDDDLRALGLSPDDETLRHIFAICQELEGFPRHLSQHVGGFIISQEPLTKYVPVLPARMLGRTLLEWDKDDIEALGMLKIDCLALGMLSCIRKSLSYVNSKRNSQDSLTLANLPPNDGGVYDMICRGDTIGVFQIESRAQMSMLPRLRPRCFYDLVIEVAIVRPGPIHGNMVHPFLRRRNGEEIVRYPDKDVQAILGKTLGVPLFQEQAMRLAIVLAEFTPGEAEKLRRTMSAWKRNTAIIESFQRRIVEGMTAKGYDQDFALSCVSQLKGFSEYGFPESHAASFALLVYASCYLKWHYPSEFACALLNSQPMGFYAPAQICKDIESRGVRILPLRIGKSDYESRCEYEQGDTRSSAIRLGLHLVKGLGKEQGKLLVRVFTAQKTALLRKKKGEFLQALWRACLQEAREQGILFGKNCFLALARADAFADFSLSRREALWEAQKLHRTIFPMEKQGGLLSPSSSPHLPSMSKQLEMFSDYEHTGLSLRAHPIEFLRNDLDRAGVVSTKTLLADKKKLGSKIQGKFYQVAGLVLFRQRPVTSRGVVFLTMEDEEGTCNLIIRPKVFEAHKHIILHSTLILASGPFQQLSAQDESSVLYLLALRLSSLDSLEVQQAAATFPGRSYSY